LGALQNTVLRRYIEEKGVGKWRKLNSEELHIEFSLLGYNAV
jgi:hypothetical protein